VAGGVEPGGPRGVLKLLPEQVHDFAKHSYGVADELGKLGIDALFSTGANACPGTSLVTGLNNHGTEQHAHVQKMSQEWDGFGDKVRDAVEALRRASETL
jgi:hypothetical protein